MTQVLNNLDAADQADATPIATETAGLPDKDLGALVDQIIETTSSAGGFAEIPGVTVIGRYPGTNRVMVVDAACRRLTDVQYRKFLALRRREIQSGVAEDEVDIGTLADMVIASSSTRAARAIPGAVVTERDEFNRPKAWNVAGRDITQPLSRVEWQSVVRRDRDLHRHGRGSTPTPGGSPRVTLSDVDTIPPARPPRRKGVFRQVFCPERHREVLVTGAGVSTTHEGSSGRTAVGVRQLSPH